jgi:hypothetical protein
VERAHVWENQVSSGIERAWFIFDGGEATIYNGLFHDSDSVTVLHGEFSSLRLINTTFAGVVSPVSLAGEGVADVYVDSSIFAAAHDVAVAIEGDVSDATIRYSLFRGYTIDLCGEGCEASPDPAEGNLSEDPAFADPEAGDYRLSDESPAVDAGNPEEDMVDTDGTRNDMGAYGGPYGSWP